MNLKEQAAREALNYVRSGMVMGLGSGSTTTIFVDVLGKQIQSGALRDIVGVPTSEKTAGQARRLGIPLASLDNRPHLDLTVDGADEVDPALNLIKGLGRALLREKVVEIHTDQFVVIVDESKYVPRLGTHVPLPVEILPFAAATHVSWLSSLGCRAEWWHEADGSPVVTDNGNYLVLCHFPNGIADAYALARTLAGRPGIVEHGLFLDMATTVLIAKPGGTQVLARPP